MCEFQLYKAGNRISTCIPKIKLNRILLFSISEALSSFVRASSIALLISASGIHRRRFRCALNRSVSSRFNYETYKTVHSLHCSFLVSYTRPSRRNLISQIYRTTCRLSKLPLIGLASVIPPFARRIVVRISRQIADARTTAPLVPLQSSCIDMPLSFDDRI